MKALNKIFTYGLFGLLSVLFIESQVISQELLYPGDYNISINYTISESTVKIGDTLVITRTVKNNESFSLANLFLSENLPQELELVSYSLKIDNVSTPVNFIGPLADEIISGYNAYYWVIDDPDPGDIFNQLLGPAQTLELKYYMSCSNYGSYQLPFHSACFYGNGSGFFAASDNIEIIYEFVPTCGDANSDGVINMLDIIFIINYRYKSGPAPNEMWTADVNSDGTYNIFDVIFLVNLLYKDGPILNCPEPAK